MVCRGRGSIVGPRLGQGKCRGSVNKGQGRSKLVKVGKGVGVGLE
ncbi:hypothetical protein 20Aug470_00002 [Pseudomonas phage 20Aug470]|nr:hypothetical protein 20Aug470_00002 [Pseudomonas phage 20Aug470]